MLAVVDAVQLVPPAFTVTEPIAPPLFTAAVDAAEQPPPKLTGSVVPYGSSPSPASLPVATAVTAPPEVVTVKFGCTAIQLGITSTSFSVQSFCALVRSSTRPVGGSAVADELLTTATR